MNYPSRSEAESACREWQAQESKVDYERELLGFEKRTKFEQENPRPDAAFWDDQIIDWEKQKLAYASKTIVESVAMGSSYCQLEQENSRFLGYNNDAIKKRPIGMKRENRASGELLNIFVIETFAILL